MSFKPTLTPNRYYFHGDLVEPGDQRAKAGEYYCDRCEAFVTRAHFYRRSSLHADDTANVAHYQSMAKSWHPTPRAQRPKGSLNLFD
ncbi:MAG: hypothetical protein AAFV46_15645 [Cyanobacteria bacterium J06635_11]